MEPVPTFAHAVEAFRVVRNDGTIHCMGQLGVIPELPGLIAGRGCAEADAVPGTDAGRGERVVGWLRVRGSAGLLSFR